MIMSFVYTVLSMVLSTAIAFANAGAAAETPGTPVWRAGAQYSFGAKLAPRWEITFDDTLTQVFDELKGETGFDIPAVAAGMPDLFTYQRWVVKLFPGIFYGLRDRWLESSPWLGVVIGMPQKLHFKAGPTDWGPDIYRLLLEMTYADGSTRIFDTGSNYNAETGDLGYGRTGMLGLGFNWNLKERWAYTAEDPFMRSLGYCKLYDSLLLQTKSINAATVRLKFPYQGKDWMLQLWKGRYFTTSGGEIGLYNKPKSRFVEFYDAVKDEDRIGMSFEVYLKGAEEPLVARPVQTHWWMTGFAIDRYVHLPGQLTLKTEIVPKDEEMLRALQGALDREAAGGALRYTVSEDGARLLIQW